MASKTNEQAIKHAVVACSDKAQLPFACMAVVSASQHLDGLAASLYIVAQGCSDAELLQANALCKDKGADVTIIPFDERKNMGDGKIFEGHHLTAGMYLRLYLDDLLPRDFQNVLYLDTDVMVVGSLRQFLEMNLGDKLFAAHADRWLELKCPDLLADYIDITKVGCFNSGVMLFNWPVVLREEFLKKTRGLKDQPGCELDQDMLNVAAAGNWYRMDGKFNATRYVTAAGEKPVILHFTSLEKPWQPNYYMRQVKYRRLYQHFVQGTRWESYVKPKTLVDWVIVAWEPVTMWQQWRVGSRWRELDRKRSPQWFGLNN